MSQEPQSEQSPLNLRSEVEHEFVMDLRLRYRRRSRRPMNKVLGRSGKSADTRGSVRIGLTS